MSHEQLRTHSCGAGTTTSAADSAMTCEEGDAQVPMVRQQLAPWMQVLQAV